MKVKDLLNGMEKRVFDVNYLADICTLYVQGDFADIENAFNAGMDRLHAVLTEDQKKHLTELEEAYIARRTYAAQHGFKCGLYGAFQQHFGGADPSDGGFQELVCDDLLKQPKMQRHHKNFQNIELCNQIDAAIMDTLSEEDQEHMISVACGWQQRVYSAALDGFYCGYRAAYDIMEAIDPLVKVRCIDKILTMEYHLGYIKPYSEVERHSEPNAA